MAFEPEKRDAMWMLQALEDGSTSIDALQRLYEDGDPVLVHLIFAWLRVRYRGHSAAEGVYGRIGALCQASSIVDRKRKEGGRDVLSQWFEEAYDLGELDRDAFIDVVVEKLEG